MLDSLISRKNFLKRSILFCGFSPAWLLGNDSSRIHVVQRGDTLSEIAAKYNTTVSRLKAQNGLKSDLIKVGQRLIVAQGFSSIANVVNATQSIRVNRSKWKYIIAHHSAIDRGNAKAYDRNHRERGMENGLAYHFVIGNGIDSGDGEIEIGDRWRKQLSGGHVRSHRVNETGIGICLVGNFELRRPTSKQINALNELIDYLGNDLLRGNFKFNVHKEIDRNHTVCPGKHFPTRTLHRRFG